MLSLLHHAAARWPSWTGAVVALGAVSPVVAQPAASSARGGDDLRTRPIALHRLQGPIVLDGKVTEPAWEAIPPLPMTMFTPSFRGSLTERTEIRLGYDDRYLYVSGRLYDSDPTGIRANTFYRDVYSGDDLIAVVLDSYNDYETALWFTTNPAGARTDRSMSNDAVSTTTFPMNPDWNAQWDVATSRDSLGWYAEFRIPFSTLRFQVVDDQVVMGLIAYRVIARKNERQTFPSLDPKWGGFAFAKPSQAQRVSLRGIHQTKPVYVAPYFLSGLHRTPSLVAPSTWTSLSDRTIELGGDVRFAPTSNLALDFTLNTDFAQAEADDQQINLTRFPLFFPEKRQFFQERASTFQFSWRGSSDRLFHSRAIGLDNGAIVRIYGGLRAVGRVGGMDYGFLSMQAGATPSRSSENVAVLRVSQQVLNPYSSIGGMVTSRLGRDGKNNVAYGLDAVVRPVGDEWAILKWAQTFDQTVGERSIFEAASLLTKWERVRDAGLTYSAEYDRVGRDYRPGLGFQSRLGYHFLGGSLQHKRYVRSASALRSVSFNVNTGHYLRITDGSAESRAIEPAVHLELKNGMEMSLTGRAAFESVTTGFPVAGATVLPGDYWFRDARLRMALSRSGQLRGELNATAGSFYDGNRIGASVAPAWNASKYVEVSGNYEINRLRFPERGQAATAHLARINLRLAANTKVTFAADAQYSNVASLTTLSARFRYNVREGNDLWLVYNEGLNTRRDIAEQPRLPLSSGRVLLMKYTHTFIW